MLHPILKLMTRLFLPVFFVAFAVVDGKAQTDSLKFPNSLKFPDKFQKTIKEQTREYERLFSKDSARTKHYSVAFMLDKIDHDSNYNHLFLAEYWMAFHYQEIIPALIKRVTNKKEVGLVNSADLIIWERVQSKQMQFYGHGGVSSDDLFTIAGRANRLLTKISGENFGHVSMHSPQEELEALQKKWIAWLKSL